MSPISLLLIAGLLTVFLCIGIYLGFKAGKRFYTQKEIDMYEAIGYDLLQIEAKKAEYQERINKLETTMRLHNIEPGV